MKRWPLILSFLSLIFLFQNCGDGLTISSETVNSNSGSNSGSSNSTPTNTETPSFSLDNWKLTLPVSQDAYFGSGGSSSAEILPFSSGLDGILPLNMGYEDPTFFYKDESGHIVFRTPLNGGTSTANSSYVRTELRELYNWQPGDSTELANWSPSGTHTLQAILQVTEFWPDDPQTVIGQIHAKDSSKALVKLQWDGLDKPVRAIINRDPSSGNPFDLTFDTVGTLEFSYKIELVNSKLTITVNDNSQSVILGEGDMSADWLTHVFYFKCGNYAQADKNGGGLFEVRFKKFEVTHLTQ